MSGTSCGAGLLNCRVCSTRPERRICWCLDFVGEFGGDFSECLFFGDLSDRTGKMVTDIMGSIRQAEPEVLTKLSHQEIGETLARPDIFDNTKSD